MSRIARAHPPARSRQFQQSADPQRRVRIAKKFPATRATCPYSESPAENAVRSLRQSFCLSRVERANTSDRQLKKLIELPAIKCAVLAGSLHFHKFPFTAHNDIHIDFCFYVFLVIQVESRFSIDHPDTHRGHAPPDRRCPEHSVGHHPVERIDDGDRSPRDRGGASASVGDKYITIELDCELAKPEIIEHSAHAAPDQSLDFLGSASQLCTLPCRACASRARKHRIFSGEPSLAAPPPPGRNTLFDRRRAQDACRAE